MPAYLLLFLLQLTRLLDNDSIGPDDVDALKDDVEYYVEQW